MMKKFIRLIITLVVIIFTFTAPVFSVHTGAFGGYNDYDYDSDSDYDSDYDYDSGRDSDSYNDNNDYTHYSSSGYVSGNNVVSSIFLLVAFAVGVPVVAFAVYLLSKRQTRLGKAGRTGSKINRRQAPLPNVYVPNRSSDIYLLIRENDLSFDYQDFIVSVKNVYRSMQKAWCEKDLSSVKDVLHRDLYERSDEQIRVKINQGITQVLEKITVDDAFLTCYRRDSEYEYVRVYLKSTMIDYQIWDETGQIICGDKTTKWTMRYDMTFMRALGTKSPSFEEDSGMNCSFDWIVYDFNAIKGSFNDTGIEI